MALTCLRMRARWRSARVLLTSANWACASSTAFCTALREADGGDDHLHVLEVRAAEVAREVGVERLRDRLLDLDEVGVRLVARGLVERAGGRAQQRARGDEVLALEAPDRLAQRVVEHGAELGVEERAEALVALPRVQPVAAAGDRIRAVAEARVELLHQLVVADWPVKAVVNEIFASSPTSTPSAVGTRRTSTPTRSPPPGVLVMM